MIIQENQQDEVSWKPLTLKQRRVLGTLMEKSKMTPDAYPMSFTGLTTGCNQKSNRAPVTNLTQDQVEQIVEELRGLGAAVLLQGSGRVDKVKHCAYQWLGLNKVEAAIITELLLRGEQTVGELRTRASRMEPIADLNSLSDMLESLEERKLVVRLTPEGRGQVVTHNLYPEWELEEVSKRAQERGYADADEPSDRDLAPHRSESKSTASSSISTTIQHDRLSEDLVERIRRLEERLEHIEREFGIQSAPKTSDRIDEESEA